jgi:hypothetical protein
MLLIILSIILGFGVKFPQLYINDFYPNCQLAGLTYSGWCFGIMHCRFLNESNFRIALTVHLSSWRTGLKQINIQT